MKKMISNVLLACILVLTIFNSNVYAQYNSKPSNWANEQVYKAISKNLVPNEMQGNYNKPITRTEYTLLALKLLEANGDEIIIKNKEPFSDISTSGYRDELIKAYNAGITKGYEDGTFKPNNKIKREEIAVLIVNLLKQLNQNIKIEVKNNYNYVDKDIISNWAKNSIDYCYDNDILSGVSKLEINPKGNATIEQSIILLYRLYNIKDTVNTVTNNSKIEAEYYMNGEKVTIDDQTINDFLNNYDTKIINILKKSLKNENIVLSDIRNESVTIALKDIGMININKSNDQVTINSYVSKIDNDLYQSVYIQLLDVFSDSSKTKQVFEKIITKLETDEEIDLKEKIGEQGEFKAKSMRINNNSFKYIIDYRNNI
ncbi:S-layer homology domain-containing protein [Lutibacter sp. B2]|nr:S-layer homology domain-containing protein [Lutibacter sp. B2]